MSLSHFCLISHQLLSLCSFLLLLLLFSSMIQILDLFFFFLPQTDPEATQFAPMVVSLSVRRHNTTVFVCVCVWGCIFHRFLEQSVLQVISTQLLLTASRMRPCLTDGDKKQSKKTNSAALLLGVPYLAWVRTMHSELQKMLAKVETDNVLFK